MSRSKPPIMPLSAMQPGELADCFALLVERKPGTTGAGKRFYTCRFRDSGRSVSCMVWADGPHFADCEQHWQIGKCYKLRGFYVHHEKYGPQVEAQQVRETTDADKADGFDLGKLVERSHHDPVEAFFDLRALV